MSFKGKKQFCSILLLLFLLLPVFYPAGVLADEPIPLSKEETAQLQKELEAIQREIDIYEKELSSVKSEKNTLSKKINQLKIQQSKIAAQIRSSNLAIKTIENRLVEVQDSIQARQAAIQSLQGQIGDLIQAVEKRDRYSALAILVTQKSIGDFFIQAGEYKEIINSLEIAVKQARAEAESLIKDEEVLGEQKEDQRNLLSISTLQNQQLASTLTERNSLLTKTKEQESVYQAILSDKQKRAAEIKNRIYDLLGVSRAVTFGEAVKIAQWAESLTGVRTAFLLAILTQESNLGRNVGTCNRPGDPPAKSWKVIMKPERDQEPFKTITAELGMDPDVTPVSCPMKDKNGKQIGWGGAMGPAQFIPSTWLGYRAKVTAITGQSANPWDIRDAFLAAAILLKANGGGARSGEWASAMKYFSGSTNPKFRFYADNVLATAEEYEQDIQDSNVE